MGCKSVRNPKKMHCLADFRHFISIIDAEISPAENSYEVDNTDIVLSIKAKVKTLSQFQVMNGINIGSDATHRFTIRYTNTVIEKNFMILFHGDLYRIESSINENEDNLFIVIDANKRGKANIGASQA